MIPYILAAVGGYLIGDSLKGKQYAYGGKVEYVGDDPYDQKYFRRFNNAIGSFAWKYDGNYNEGILYPLDTFDKEYYSHIELKKDEVLLRYRTDRMLKDEKHLIKFNLDKALIYFFIDSDDDKNPKFETRGIKAEYIVISKDYAPKIMADGGMMDRGGLFTNKKHRFILEKNGEVHGINYELIGIQADGTEDVISEHTTQLGAEKKAKNWQKTASPKYVSWEIRIKKFAKGGTIDEQLEKINIYNDLDEFEYRQYKRMVDSGISKVDALKVLINNVEGDTSQLSKKLASVAKKIKYSDGGRTEPELPHRYKIGDKIAFMNADYSTNRGKIVKQEVRYINMGGYNLYMVELENGKITPVAESDILDDFSKNRKFYNPD